MNKEVVLSEETAHIRQELLDFYEIDRRVQDFLKEIGSRMNSHFDDVRNSGACSLLHLTGIINPKIITDDNVILRSESDIEKEVCGYFNRFIRDPLDYENCKEIYSLYKRIVAKEYMPAKCQKFFSDFRHFINSGGTFPAQNDDFSDLAKCFIDSKYSGRADEVVARQLRQILRECSDPNQLIDIIQFGEAKDLDDLLECNEIDVGDSHTPLRKRGEEAFFNVYEGIDALSERWALKLPRKGILEPFVEKMKISKYELLEKMGWNTINNIDHKNISKIYILLGNNGEPFFVEELMDCTLKEILSKENLDYERAVNYFSGLASGLDAAHQKKRLHLDIKPNNLGIKLAEDRLLIFDWSVSTNIMDLYPEKLGVGGLLYRPPEMFDGYNPSIGVDIYSMGVVAFEMFTGKHPVLFGSGYTPQDFPLREERKYCTEFIRDRIFRNKFNTESEEFLREHVKDEKLTDCIVSCMSKEPNQRPSDAEILYNLNHVA